MSRSIIKEITIYQSPDATFDALITPSLIKKWWLASGLVITPEKEGLNMIIWTEKGEPADYISSAKITEYIRPKKLLLTNIKYTSEKGHLPLMAEMNAEFLIHQEKDHIVVKLKQTGFPDDHHTDEFYRTCSTEWEKTFS